MTITVNTSGPEEVDPEQEQKTSIDQFAAYIRSHTVGSAKRESDVWTYLGSSRIAG